MKLPTIRPHRKVVLILLLVLLFAWLIPAPFKPSPYSTIYSYFVGKSLDKNTAPVYLPSGAYLQHVHFTAYRQWHNTYEIRYNANRKGVLDQYAYFLQFSSDSRFEQDIEGPARVSQYWDAVQAKDCTPLNTALSVRLCPNAFLVRDFDYGGQRISVVSKVFSPDLSPTDSLEYKLLQTLKLHPLTEARKAYFRPEY